MQDSLSITQQLALRAKSWCTNLGLTQSALARLLKIDVNQMSKFLRGEANLGSDRLLQLVKLLSLSKRDLQLVFSAPEKLTSRLMHLQEGGRELAEVVHFAAPNDGWVPGLTHPILSDDDITTVRSTGAEGDDPSYDDLTRVLAQVQGLHRQAISTIEAYEARQRARVNSTLAQGEIARGRVYTLHIKP